jgi:hypothetical protein
MMVVVRGKNLIQLPAIAVSVVPGLVSEKVAEAVAAKGDSPAVVEFMYPAAEAVVE